MFNLLLWFLLASATGLLWGQPPTDLDTPAERAAYAERLTAESEAAKAEAELWALEHGMPVYDNDGYHIRELMAILDGRPVYYTTRNVQSATSIATDRVRDILPWDLNGEGWAVGVWDAAGVRASHQEFVGPDGLSRVKVRDSIITSSHSTHVAGTIAAAGVDPSARGMAPGARIESYDWDNDTAQMFTRAASGPGQPERIYVSNHSYGYGVGWEYLASMAMSGYAGWHWTGNWAGADSYEDWFGQYNTITRQWDEVAHLNPYYLACAAAGNDRSDRPAVGETVYYYTGGAGWRAITYSPDTCPPGDGQAKGGYDTISGPAVAKNIVTVGAVHKAISGGTRSCVRAAMARFSCWGPTDDGRIKPDIVTNGIDVYSCDHNGDSGYDTYSGTSMASPAAAGSAILLVQHYARLFPGQAMRASTLKALILHTADDLGRVGPDYSYGWGLMNTRAAAELIQTHHDLPAGSMIREGRLNAQAATDSHYFYTDGTQPIRVTLCWTDPPAQANNRLDDASPCLIHDLDVRIIGPGGSPTYCPYTLNPADPSAVAGTGDNKLDNIEQVYIATPGQAGVYEVKVSYKNNLANGQQYFSLISSVPVFDQRPPVAKSVETVVSQNASATITLMATDDGLPDPPGKISYMLMTVPEHGTLHYPDGTAIGQPGELAPYANQVVYTPALGFTGEDLFTFCAEDGGTAPFGGASNSAVVRISVKNISTREYQVGAGEDDATAVTGYQLSSGRYLWVGQYSSAFRFQGIDVPRGSQIVVARLKLYAAGSSKSTGAVHAEAAVNPADFTTMNPRVYDRPRTGASTPWNWQGTEKVNAWYSSPDIAKVVQEVTDRSDWSAGSTLVIIYAGTDFGGEGTYFLSYEADPALAAKLEIAYVPPSDAGPAVPQQPGLTPPTAMDAQRYASANAPLGITLEATDDGPPGSLSFTIRSLPGHGSLEYPDGTPITQPGTLTVGGNRVTYRPDPDFTGDDAFTFHADDGGSAPAGGSSNVATVSIRVRNMVTRQYQVIMPEDDAYGADGPPVVLSDLLSVGRHDSAMRFQNVDILPASEVVSARLQLNIGTPDIQMPMDGLLQAQAIGHAGDFAAAGLRISDLPKTQANSPWSWQAGDNGPVGTFRPSPDISAVIQEVIDRPDWLIDNALVVLYSGDRTAGQDVQFFACESPYSGRAARLEITCGLQEPVILPPTVNQSLPVAQDITTETPFNMALTVTLSATDDGLPNPPGQLTYTIASLPSHGILEYPQGGPIVAPGVLPGFSDQVIYRPATDFIGPDSFAFYADDGAVPQSSGESNIAVVKVMVRPPLTQRLTSESFVNASGDDAFAALKSTSNNLVDPVLKIGLNTSGMRFTDINIPQGSKIIEARLSVRVSTSWLPQGVAGIIQAEATGNAAGFLENDRLVGTLRRTEAFVDWIWTPGSYAPGWRDAATWRTSPDIKQVIQEIVDRSDWTPGNAIAVLIWSQNIPRADLELSAYDNSPTTPAAVAPKLSIIYAPNSPQAPGPADPQPVTPVNTTTCVLRVTDMRDDASASALDSTNFIFDKHLKVGTRMSAMRFAGADIPQGGTIVKAHLKISLLSMQLADRIDGLVQAEATGNALNFLAAGRYLYDLPRTSASVAWVWEPGFYKGYDLGETWKVSPDISAVVQEVVNRPDWSAGNAIAILLACTNQPRQDLQFVAYGYCDPGDGHCSSSRYQPPALEITYAP